MLDKYTPDWYYHYFQNQVTNNFQSPYNWTRGFQAAQLWKNYHDGGRIKPTQLYDIIEVLMPSRYDGSGFLALWMDILHHFGELPVDIQVSLWQQVFDPRNHGDRSINGTEQVAEILTLWQSVCIDMTQTAVNLDVVVELVELLYPYLFAGHEWASLIRAIDHSIQGIQPQTSLFERIAERWNAR